MESNEPLAIGWLNGNDYKQSQETFGILPLPRASQVTLGMHQHSDEFATGEKIKHADLAKQQQTQVAILPVHTPAERALFWLYHASKSSSAGAPDLTISYPSFGCNPALNCATSA